MFLYCVIIFISFTIWYIDRKLNYWRRRGIPQNDLWNPLGDMSGIGSTYGIFEKFDMIYKKFKNIAPVHGIYSMLDPMMVATDLHLIKSIMVKDFHTFTDHGVYCCEEADPLTAHLFNLEGEKWKRMRNNLSPTFTSGKVKGMFHIVEEKGRDFLKYLENTSKLGEGVLTKDANGRFTADVVASTAFGLETRALHTDKPLIIDILQKLRGDGPLALFYMMILSSFPNLSAKLKLKEFSKEAIEFFTVAVQDALEYREKNNVKRHDFLNMLKNLKNRGTISDNGEIIDDKKLTFNEVLAQAFVFLAAGYDTTAGVLSFAMYFIAKHQDIQEKLREEIKIVRARHNGKLDYEAVSELQYMTQVVNETMRLYPPSSSLVRKCSSDYQIPNSHLVIPKGVMVMIPNGSIQRDPEFFPDPERFDPDRFSPEEISKRDSYTFLPFGEGPRNCIGMRFAYLQLKYGLAVVVENMKLTVNKKTKEPLVLEKTNPLPMVEGGIWIDFEKL